MNSELKELIRLNNIDEEVLFDALHRDVIESILSEICEYMKEGDNQYLFVKRIYYRNSNDIETIKNVVRTICHISLPEQDYIWLNKCVKAYMTKKPKRKQFSITFRQELLNKQGNKCCVCGKAIQLEDSHVDHIVPWDFVGDELKDNYQLLCSNCNLHKSNHVALAVHSLILKKI